MEPIFWIALEWAICDKEFADVSLHDLALSWEACFIGGREVSPMIHSSWMCPPGGLLK